jgi:putative transposase
METRRQAHAVYRCQYHLVWIPRYRYEILTNGVAKYLKIKLDEVRKYYPEIEYIEKTIESDHVHLLISFPPKHSVAKVVQIIKQNTGRALREKFDFLKERYHGRGGI